MRTCGVKKCICARKKDLWIGEETRKNKRCVKVRRAHAQITGEMDTSSICDIHLRL